MAYFSKGDANLGDSVGPQGMNNNIESIYNRTNKQWLLWDATNYQGSWIVSSTPGKGNLTGSSANVVSSLKPS